MGLAVLVHELGHFMAARKFGVRCHEFAIGMGPILWKKRKGETLYTIRAIPIGGFVSMGMNESERDLIKEGSEIGLTLDPDGHVVKIHVQPEEGQIMAVLICNTIDVSNDLEIAVEVAGERKIYPVSRDAWYIDSKADHEKQVVPCDRMLESKPKLQRFTIMAAGAVMNFVLAYVLALIIGAIAGEVIGTSSELAIVGSDGPAYVAGLQVGDRILEIDGVIITDGTELRDVIQEVGANEVTIVFERDGLDHETTITPNFDEQRDIYLLDIDIVAYTERSFAGTFRSANRQWRNGAMMIFDTLRMLGTGEVGANQLAGFVGIAQMTGQVASLGILPLLSFASLININLGIFNLLPFPALDGGHITFIIIEAIIGKPVSPKIQHGVAIVGIILLLGLMAYVTFHDVLRIFG